MLVTTELGRFLNTKQRETDDMDESVFSVMDDSLETLNSKIQKVITLDFDGDA